MLTVTVTEADAANARRHDCTGCLLATALKREHGFAFVSITGYIQVRRFANSALETYIHTDVTRRVVRLFDAGKKLDLPMPLEFPAYDRTHHAARRIYG